MAVHAVRHRTLRPLSLNSLQRFGLLSTAVHAPCTAESRRPLVLSTLDNRPEHLHPPGVHFPALRCSALSPHSYPYIGSLELASSLEFEDGNKMATGFQLPSKTLVSGAKGCGFDPRRAQFGKA
jgi:hypothetical protein